MICISVIEVLHFRMYRLTLFKLYASCFHFNENIICLCKLQPHLKANSQWHETVLLRTLINDIKIFALHSNSSAKFSKIAVAVVRVNNRKDYY